MIQTIDVSDLTQNDIQQLESFLQHLRMKRHDVSKPAQSYSETDIDHAIDELSRFEPPLPILPQHFTRDDIYFNHD